jgi:putative nucleotidyltransferase with HDIG domain
MKCPGQDTQYWKPGAIFEANCPECGKTVEFFKDDTTRKCGHCGHRFLNPNMDFGCASYCQYAEQCIGDLPPELLAQKDDLLKDRVAVEMKRYFKTDFKRIGHAGRVARYADRIGRAMQASLPVILSAAYLHDIGIPEAERQHGAAAAAETHAREGVPVAREILTRLGAPEPMIEAVCNIISNHHQPGADTSPEFMAVYDADRIANLEDMLQQGGIQREDMVSRIETDFLTDAGRDEARKVLID